MPKIMPRLPYLARSGRRVALPGDWSLPMPGTPRWSGRAKLQPGPIMPIGRLPGNALVLDDDYVSSEHALLAWREGRWWLSDVASTNGTFLNGQPVTRPVQVNWGDVIGVGGVRLRLEP